MLVPRICMNRLYSAAVIAILYYYNNLSYQGVSLASQESWKLLKDILGVKDGIQFLNEYVKEVLEYYMSQLNEKNYEIVETSLNAFKEMFNVILDINKEKIAFLIPDFIKFIVESKNQLKL